MKKFENTIIVKEVKDLCVRFDRRCRMCRQMVQKIQGFYLFYETDEYLCQGCFGSNLEEVGAKIENRQETKYMRMIQI